MATMSIKTTYSLDAETVRVLDEMARHWRVSKSEALRRAIRTVGREVRADKREALTALDELQDSLALGKKGAREWAEQVRRERRASSSRAERRK